MFCLPSILRFLIAVALGLITASGLVALLFANLVIRIHGPLLSDCLGIHIEGLGLTLEAGCFGLDCWALDLTVVGVPLHLVVIWALPDHLRRAFV